MVYFLLFVVLAAIATCIAFAAMRRRKAGLIAGLVALAAFVGLGLQPRLRDDSPSQSETIAKAAGLSTTGEATGAPDPTDAPTATPDRHAERQPYQDYWNKVIGELALAQLALHYASDALEQGDPGKASQLLGTGEKQADLAKDATSSDVPDEWQGSIGPALYSGASDTSDALAKARAWLDDNKPSEIADAQDTAERAKDEIDSATHDARVSYVEMGGKGDDLESMDESIADLKKGFDAILQSSGSGN